MSELDEDSTQDMPVIDMFAILLMFFYRKNQLPALKTAPIIAADDIIKNTLTCASLSMEK